jgi:glycosyltransferase involved in cell wall biosynthesis
MVSVCITTFNGEKYIFEQLQSILNQLNQEDEVIVSDDGSTDTTIEIIKDFNDKRIRIYVNEKDKGLISNVENSLIHAKGDYIFLSDQDDIWLPEKVNVCKSYLQQVDLVVSDCYVTDKELKIIHDSFIELNNSQQNKWKALFRNPYLGCCMAFKRSVLTKALPFPDKIPMHDIWIGNVAAFHFNVKFIPQKLICYRRHGLNASTASEPTKAGFFKKIDYRTSLIFSLINLIFNFKSKKLPNEKNNCSIIK